MSKICLAAILAILLCACSRSETISVPIEYCADSQTGQQRTGTDVSYVCTAYDKSGICTVNVPIYSNYTQVEVMTTCRFSEWRRI